MAFIKQFFSRSKKKTTNNSVVNTALDDNISLELLKQLIPVRNLSDDELISFSLKNLPESYPLGSTLFRQGDDDGSVLYLLDGAIETDTDGQKHPISSDTPEARFPLSRTKRHSATAYATTEVRVLRVSNKIMGQEKQSTDLDLRGLPEGLSESQLLQAFWEACQDNTVNLPIQTKLIPKIKKLTTQATDTEQLAEVAMLDPALTARLLRVANSPLYVPAISISDCHDACNRIGHIATQQLFLRAISKNRLRSKNAEISQRLTEAWHNNLLVSQIAAQLAKDTKKVNPEDARLGGLLCDIGVLALLQFAENFPKEYCDIDELDQATPFVRGAIGNQILNNWGLPEKLATLPDLAENWYYDSGESLTVSDIVTLSKYISYISTKMAELPILGDLPAFNKLPPGLLSEEHLSKLIHKAEKQVNRMLRPSQPKPT